MNHWIHIPTEARASLRHHLSAAMVFPSETLSQAKVNSPEQQAHGDKLHERVMDAIDQWFAFYDAHASEQEPDATDALTQARDALAYADGWAGDFSKELAAIEKATGSAA